MGKHRTGGTRSRIVCGVTLVCAFGAVALLAQQPPMPVPGQAPPQPAPRQAQPAVQTPPAAQAQPQAVPERTRGGRRDPFRSLLARTDEASAAQALPPGKRGLMIGQIRVDGIVRGPSDRIAVVTVPNRNRAYFLREQDELFNGYVAEIQEDVVIFKERTTDAFGKPYEREVVKQITSAGAKR